jgi:hypothetical protein
MGVGHGPGGAQEAPQRRMEEKRNLFLTQTNGESRREYRIDFGSASILNSPESTETRWVRPSCHFEEASVRWHDG